MKKIAVIGCSFSRWIEPKFRDKPHKAKCWPFALSQINEDLEVHNYAMYANSCNMQYFQAVEFIKRKQEYDAFVVQWTTENRFTFMINPKEPLPYLRITQYSDKIPNYFHIPEEENKWMNINNEMMHISPGVLKRFTDREIKNNRFLSAGVTFMTNGVGVGGYYGSRESIKALQLTLKEIAKSSGAPLYQMDWLDRQDSVIENDIDTVDLIVEKHFSFKEYVADEGYHFNSAGSDAVATKVNDWIKNNV